MRLVRWWTKIIIRKIAVSIILFFFSRYLKSSIREDILEKLGTTASKKFNCKFKFNSTDNELYVIPKNYFSMLYINMVDVCPFPDFLDNFNSYVNEECNVGYKIYKGKFYKMENNEFRQEKKLFVDLSRYFV